MSAEAPASWSASLEAALSAWSAGELTGAEARRARGLHGLHEMRDGRWMLRVKACGGRLRPAQLSLLAETARELCGGRPLHLTSRQGVELHGLELKDAAAVAEDLKEAGLSTRGAGGDGVRNVSVPASAGLEVGDPFDPYPYALAFARYFEGRAEFEALPRKFKVAFSSPAEAAPNAWFHDLAFISQNGPAQGPGFRVLVGGGLGAAPAAAKELRAFVPAGDVLRVACAVGRVWNERGERRHRHEGRLKYLVRAMGIQGFAHEVRAMEQSQPDPGALQPAAYRPPQGAGPAQPPASSAEGYADWMARNARPQAGGGYYAVVRTHQGQLPLAAVQGLAELAQELGLPELRLSTRQQVYLPGLDTAALPGLHRRLAALGLARSGAGSLADVSACPGPRACNLGTADPRALAADLAARLDKDLDAAGMQASLRVSGCANSCCHHRAATLGLQGMARQSGGRWYPAFKVFAGGGGEGELAFGRETAVLPAALVVPAIQGLMDAYRSSRKGGEALAPWLRRRGQDLDELFAPFSRPDPTQASHFKEPGATQFFVPYARGVGQC